MPKPYGVLRTLDLAHLRNPNVVSFRLNSNGALAAVTVVFASNVRDSVFRHKSNRLVDAMTVSFPTTAEQQPGQLPSDRSKRYDFGVRFIWPT